MFISEPITFHDAIKPLVYSNWFIGMGALRQENQSGTVQFLLDLYTVLITLVNWTIIYFNLTWIPQVIQRYNPTCMRRLMYYAVIYANTSTVVIAPFLIWLERKGIKDCLRQMPILDDTFQAILGAQKNYRREYIRMSCHIISVFLVMFSVGIYDAVFSLEMELEMDIRSVLTFLGTVHTLHQPIMFMLLLDLNFYTFVRYLENKFRDLNSSLLDLTKPPSTFQPGRRIFIIPKNLLNTRSGPQMKNAKAEDFVNGTLWLLREIRKAHLELCRLSQKINVVFGLQNLLSTAVSFSMITGMLYAIYGFVSEMNFNSRKIKELITSILWTAIYVSKIWKVNHSCWKVSNEADRTGEVIYELLQSRVDNELDTEMNGFALQLLKNPIRFDACGFFTLDYTFVQGVIASVTTNLVILIQMSSPRSQMLDAAFSGNKTQVPAN